jgi:type VI secretion system protein ImpM
MTAIVFGKLPSRGDFIVRGALPEERECLDRWLSASMVAARQLATDAFEVHFDVAQGLLVRLDLGSRSATGAIIPSHDSVGRRFPLLMAFPGVDPVEGLAERCRLLLIEARELRLDPDELRRRADDLQPTRPSCAATDSVATRGTMISGLPKDIIVRMLTAGGTRQ